MLRIGQFSKLSKTTVKALRYYDKIGLLKPVMIDTATSYRYYSEEQLSIVRLISMYKRAGLSNDTILKLLHHKGDERTLLEQQRLLLLEKEREIKTARSCLDVLLEKEEKQTYTASIKTVERRLVYCCRGYIASVEHIHDFIRACADELRRSNPDVRLSEPDYCCVVYPKDGFREANVFIEYMQSVDRYGVDTAILKFKEIETISVVSVLHYGGYDNLRDAYLYAVNYANKKGYELSGEPRERYINGKWNKDDISEWLTELQLPVKEC